MTDENGQIAVDFLLGISLVLIAISFTMQFIPGMFIAGTSGESSLDYTAYRTATILAEDPGWWENSTLNGTDWESNPANTMRIGLAVDDEPRTRLTNSPDLISKSKIEQFMLLNESILTEMLGLYNNVGGTHFIYGYNISLTQQDSPLILNNTTIVRGMIPPENVEIAKITRLILVEHGTTAVFTGDEIAGVSSSKTSINVTGPVEENITIQMRSLNISGANPKFVNATLDGTVLTQSSNFTIYKMEGWNDTALIGSLNSEDVICLNFDHNLFNLNMDYRLDLEFNNVTFINNGSSFLNYNNRSKVHYEPSRLTVEVW
jgi:hypothetical protein